MSDEVDAKGQKAKRISKLSPAGYAESSSIAQVMRQIEREKGLASATIVAERTTSSLAQQANDAISKINALANPPINRLLEESSKLAAMSLAADRTTYSLAQQAQEAISRANALTNPSVPLSARKAPNSAKIKSARDIGLMVRTARKRMKLNQQAFADTAGVGRRFVSELESGKATLEFDKVMRVCAIAGVEIFAAERQNQ